MMVFTSLTTIFAVLVILTIVLELFNKKFKQNYPVTAILLILLIIMCIFMVLAYLIEIKPLIDELNEDYDKRLDEFNCVHYGECDDFFNFSSNFSGYPVVKQFK